MSLLKYRDRNIIDTPGFRRYITFPGLEIQAKNPGSRDIQIKLISGGILESSYYASRCNIMPRKPWPTDPAISSYYDFYIYIAYSTIERKWWW